MEEKESFLTKNAEENGYPQTTLLYVKINSKQLIDLNAKYKLFRGKYRRKSL